MSALMSRSLEHLELRMKTGLVLIASLPLSGVAPSVAVAEQGMPGGTPMTFFVEQRRGLRASRPFRSRGQREPVVELLARHDRLQPEGSRRLGWRRVVLLLRGELAGYAAFTLTTSSRVISFFPFVRSPPASNTWSR